MKKTIIPALLIAAATFAPDVLAQDVAVKTNVIADALLNVNLGAEVKAAPKWSVELTGELNLWSLSHRRKWKHWYVMPEGRFWFCDAFNGHFIGLHVMTGQFNIGGFNGRWNLLGTDARNLSENRYQGWFYGAGIGYGYSWPLGVHWNLEAEIGIGWSHADYDQYKCHNCGKKIKGNQSHDYVGPSKAAVNIEYIF